MSKQLKYRDLLVRLKEECPDHHMISFLEKGYSPIRMRHILKAVFEEDHTRAKTVKTIIVQNRTSSNDIYKEQRHLMSQKAVLSNSFHDCSTDQERRAISVQINKLHTIIRQNRDTLSSGGTPSQPTGDKNAKDLEKMTKYEASKKLASLRVMNSRFKSKLKQLASLPEGHPNKEKIPLIEGKLKANELNKEHVENIIKAASL